MPYLIILDALNSNIQRVPIRYWLFSAFRSKLRNKSIIDQLQKATEVTVLNKVRKQVIKFDALCGLRRNG